MRAAEALHLHRNTLLYRLARIQAIGGLDLDDPEVRLAVQVALRLRPVAVTRSRSLPVPRAEERVAEELASLSPGDNGEAWDELATSPPAARAERK